MEKEQNYLTILQEALDKDIDRIVESQDYSLHKTPLKTTQKLKEEFRANLVQAFDLKSMVTKSLDTVKLILDNIHLACSPVEAESVKKEIADSGQHYRNYVKGEVSNQENFQQIFQLSNQCLIHIYQLAQYFFKHHEFQKAKDILYMLTCLSPQTPSFWIGLGVCHQNEKILDEALMCFEAAELLNSSNPYIIIRKIECLLEKNERKDAKEEFKKLSNLLNNNNELQNKWKTPYEALRKKIGTSI